MSITEPLTPQTAPPASAQPTDPSQINLAGYELQSLLGTGGYGEVWKAIGPGGFAKAVKVLYGRSDGDQAETELKSLNRMRQLRHPFLLNIERVELCNNRLIVVTELADGNLNERFDACVNQGRIGIPRDELLSYLRDAADALDFMSEEHSLQHLDIKPDNLLLQGKHAKLGDFGLAKEFDRPNVSMVNGFTPLYAAPELFEGHPSRTSDQYSLAIVFQAMLTGTPPFNGRNAAQLTSQHLRSQPDLTALPPADRPVIARALSKTATARFASCREFVDELTARSHRVQQPSASVGMAAPKEVTSPQLNGDTQTLDKAERPTFLASEPLQVSAGHEQPAPLCPTLFIGVGGLAGGVLRQLKRLWHKASDEAIPMWQVLAIDTDSDSLRTVHGLPEAAQLNNSETLPIALRTSAEYRKASNLDMSWLSRRWLFNIPRSARVEGMRPLGRLAVQDNLTSLKTRIRDRMRAATEADALAVSNENLPAGVDQKSLNVVLLAGTAGGTGSGAVIDIALIVQELRSEFPDLNVRVHGLLLQSTSYRERVAGIHTANSIACLKELQAQGRADSVFPRGFSKHASGLRPFDETWLMDAGDQLTESDFEELQVNLAQFLYNTSATPVASRWQKESNDSAGMAEDCDPEWRLLGLSTVDRSVYSMAESEAASLSLAVIEQWLAQRTTTAGSNEAGSAISGAQVAKELLTTLKLTAATVPERILAELKGESGRRIERIADQLFQQPEASVESDGNGEQFPKYLTDFVATSDHTVLSPLAEHAGMVVQEQHTSAHCQIRQLLLQLGESDSATQTSEALRTMDGELANAIDSCVQLKAEAEAAVQSLVATSGGNQTATENYRELCRQVGVLCGSRVIYDSFLQSMQELRDSLSQIGAELNGVSERLQQIQQLIKNQYRTHDGIPVPVVDSFQSCLSTVEALHPSAVLQTDHTDGDFIQRLIGRATGFLMNAGNAGGSSATPFATTAWPRYQGNGGRHRVIAWAADTLSHDQWKMRLTEEFGECVSVHETTSSRISAVCEIQGVDSNRLLKAMQLNERGAWEMAERIHTRIDVQW